MIKNNLKLLKAFLSNIKYKHRFARNSDVIPVILSNLRKDIITVLDIGCGQIWDNNEKKEDILFSVFNDSQYQITGIDIFQDCISWRNEYGPKGNYKLMDVRNLNDLPGLFDVIVAHHILEHLPKNESKKALDMIEKKARKQIIIGTPIGFTDTEYAVKLHNNEHERHLCSWYPSEFKNRNYKVYKIKNVLLAIKNI